MIFKNTTNTILEQSIIAQCNCSSVDHLLKASYFVDDDEDTMLYVHTHLNKKPFWKRVGYALKYIFGFQSRFGAYDEVLFDVDEAKEIRDFIESFIIEKDISLDHK
jgi:hypothetical protein